MKKVSGTRSRSVMIMIKYINRKLLKHAKLRQIHLLWLDLCREALLNCLTPNGPRSLIKNLESQIHCFWGKVKIHKWGRKKNHANFLGQKGFLTERDALPLWCLGQKHFWEYFWCLHSPVSWRGKAGSHTTLTFWLRLHWPPVPWSLCSFSEMQISHFALETLH